MGRKTIDVTRVLEMGNHYLASPDLGDADKFRNMRKGAASLLESVLHETGNYGGFQYLETYRPNDPTFDDTRRRYYDKSGLRY